MANAGRNGCGVHLVGSVPLDSSEAVFRATAAALGPWMARFPDGETGTRTNWIEWQIPMLGGDPALEVVPPDPDHYRPLPRVAVRDGSSADDIALTGCGYADAAEASYVEFRRLRDDGVIAADARFQVCLPTPLATVALFVTPEDQAAVEAVYERLLLADLDRVLATIPHEDLAIQWDTAVEFGVLEGLFPVWFEPAEAGVVDRLVRIGNRVPVDVELGFHLCYGDAGHQHFTQPTDAAVLVRVANALADGLDRPLNWLHLPVPRERDDVAYYAPLADLRLSDDTELYLGLVHRTDGMEGTQRRMAAASKVVPAFGISTECGLGRRPSETVPELLELHAAVAKS
ncbi:MAG: hypothetical protein QOE09_2018 [Ilumatobacteraceae bacterium]